MRFLGFFFVFFSLYGENFPLISTLESDPSALVEGRVNALSGSSFLYEEDLVIQGVEPIRITRTYIDDIYGYWRFTTDFARVEETDKPYRWIVWEKDRCPIIYKKIGMRIVNERKYIECEPSNLEKGFSNTSRGKISGRSNLKNNRVLLQDSFRRFTVLCSDGTSRFYKKLGPAEVDYALVSEHLPNGNWILYQYEKVEIGDDIESYHFNLMSIRTMNPSKTVTYARADFIYEDPKQRNKHFFIKGSDGQSIEYGFQIDKRGLQSGHLETVRSSAKPEEVVAFDSFGEAQGRRLSSVSFPLERKLGFDYSKGRIKTISNANQISHSFVYERDRKTRVYDAEGNWIEYFPDAFGRVKKWERFSREGKCLDAMAYQWGEGEFTGCLMRRSHLDGNLLCLFSTEYVYDARGNVLEERFRGGDDLYSKKYRYGESNLALEEWHDSGLHVEYRYLKGTDLLTAKFVGDQKGILLCQFFEYDADHLLRRVIEEEGGRRLIREITPLKSGPFVGMPEVFEEKYWDGSREILLKKVVLTYTTGAKIAREDVFDGNGVKRFSLEMKYDAKGRLIEKVNAIGEVERFSYDLCGNKIAQHEGRIASFSEYNLFNQMIVAKKVGDDGICLQKALSYDRKGRLICEADPRGHETVHQYDGRDLCIETRLPKIGGVGGNLICPRTQQEFDSAGNLILKVDAEGNATKFLYNAYGKPVLVVHPDGTDEKYEYFPDGNLKSHRNEKGIVTSYVLDALGRVIKKNIGGFFSEESFVYQGKLLSKKTDAEGFDTLYGYDGAGRKISEERAGEKIFFSYDSFNRLQKIQKGDLVKVTEYDLLDRVLEQRSEDLFGQVLRKTTFEYDQAGNPIKIIEDGAFEEKRSFDSMGRLKEKIDPLGFVETISYDDFYQNEWGQKVLQTTHTDPLGLKTFETFDSHGRGVKVEKSLFLEEKWFGLNGLPSLKTHGASRIQWKYDARGRLKTLVEAEGKTTHYDYSLSGELSQILKPNGVQLFYGYDGLGFLTSLRSSDGSVHHEMRRNRLGHLVESDGFSRVVDAYGRVLREAFVWGVVEHQYDAMGRRFEMKIPRANCFVTYDFGPIDLRGIFRKDLRGNALYSHHYLSYDRRGNLLEEEGLGGQICYEVDALSRRVGISSSVFSQKGMIFDGVGNLRNLRWQGEDVVYGYDDLYRLTEEPGGKYAYDSLQNRVLKNGMASTFDVLNRNIFDCIYDANGNPVQEGDTFYSYDALDRLIQLRMPGITQEFAYDAQHRCLSKTTNGKTQHFIYDGKREIGSLDDMGRLLELRILGNTPHAEIGSAIAIELQGSVYAPIHDVQGNVAALIPFGGGEPVIYRYSAFGEERGGGVFNPWRFFSKRTDEKSGLVHFGRRFYSPKWGRFLTLDPLGFVDGMNGYAFVKNNPLVHGDEYGLVTFDSKSGWQNSPWNSQYSYTTPQGTAPLGFMPPSAWNTNRIDSRMIPSMNFYPEKTPHYYVNGIQNRWADNMAGAARLQRTFDGNANLRPFHSESFGFWRDLRSVHHSRKDPDYTTKAIQRLNQSLQTDILCMDALQDPRKIFITGFSRGSTDIYHAVKDFTPAQRDRLMITVCGPIMVLPRDLGFSVLNLVSEGDWCSFFCNSGLRKHPERYRDDAWVEILPQIDGRRGLKKDHFFQSQTYQDGIKDFGVPLHEEYSRF